MRSTKLAMLAFVSIFAIATTALAQSSATETASAPTPTKKQVRQSNWKTEKAVRKALNSTQGLDSSAILVVVRGSKVMLDGTVPDNSQIQFAQSAAKAATPGKTIVNNLSVRQEGH